MRAILSFAALLATVVTLSGCIGVRSGMVGDYTPPLVKERASAAIELAVTGRIVFDDREEEPSTATWGAFTDLMLSAYRQSGMFSEVRRAPEAADFRAEIDVANTGKGRPFLLGLLTFITLNMIPSTHWEQYTVSTTFKDDSGSTLGTYTQTERVRIWYQTLLIFATPFATVGDAQIQAFHNLAYATLEEARKDGIFNRP